MDYSIISVIKKDDLLKIGVAEKLTGWEDEVMSFSPKRFYSEDDVQLLEIQSDIESGNYIALKVVDGLRELELQANRSKEMFKRNNIMKLLEKICYLDYFNIIIKEDDSKIEKEIEYNYNNSSPIYDIIVEALDWDKPLNLKIYKRIPSREFLVNVNDR